MTLPHVPGPPTPAAGWTLADYKTATATGKADATGTGTATFDPVPDNQLWQVTRAVVATSTAQAGCSARLYVTSGLQAAGGQADLVSGTNSGNFDEADYAGNGITVLPGQQLQAVWAGAAPGAALTLAVTYQLLVQDD